MKNPSIAIIGLGVMGKALARNFATKDINLLLWNRRDERERESFPERVIEKYSELSKAQSFSSLEELIHKQESPRNIILMISSGEAVDQVLDVFLSHLSPGDRVFDFGNSFYQSTNSRAEKLSQKSIFYFGVGISGGEQGSLYGPSLMFGGNCEEYEKVKSLFLPIVASNSLKQPALGYFGIGGAGHYVKMVHNGIEYGEMQILSELALLGRDFFEISDSALTDLFVSLNNSSSKSYLTQAFLDILKTKDEVGNSILEGVGDRARSKGTGTWMLKEALDLGVWTSVLSEALFARSYSADLNSRKIFGGFLNQSNDKNKKENSLEQIIKLFKENFERIYNLAMKVNYIQGFLLLSKANQEYGFQISAESLIKTWSSGCILSAKWMTDLLEGENSGGLGSGKLNLQNLSMSELIAVFVKTNSEDFSRGQTCVRELIVQLNRSGVRLPAIESALQWIDTYSSDITTGRFIQGLRDYFGGHQVEFTDSQTGLTETKRIDWFRSP